LGLGLYTGPLIISSFKTDPFSVRPERHLVPPVRAPFLFKKCGSVLAVGRADSTEFGIRGPKVQSFLFRNFPSLALRSDRLWGAVGSELGFTPFRKFPNWAWLPLWENLEALEPPMFVAGKD
jgi:hypothetical protein